MLYQHFLFLFFDDKTAHVRGIVPHKLLAGWWILLRLIASSPLPPIPNPNHILRFNSASFNLLKKEAINQSYTPIIQT